MTVLAIEWAPLLTKIGGLFLMLSILIVMHELGHFIPAKLFKTRVEKFYLFFDFLFPFPNIANWSLFKKKKGETEYGLGWFPFGGYVKIAGMIDESMDKEQMMQPPQPWEFRSKPAWQRLIIMIGGVTVNLVLGWIIYSMILFTWGDRSLPLSSMKDGIWCADSLSYELGFRNGDKIISLDGKNYSTYEEVKSNIFLAKNVVVEREGKQVELKFPDNLIGQLIEKRRAVIIQPRITAIFGEYSDSSVNKKSGLVKGDTIRAINGIPVRYIDEFKSIAAELKNTDIKIQVSTKKGAKEVTMKVDGNGKVGCAFQLPADYKDMEQLGIYKIEHKHYSFLGAFPAGFNKAVDKLGNYLRQLKAIFTPKTGAYKGVGGFITMGSIIPYPWDWEAFWSITAFISLILAVMNLLPIPMLDGGYVLFLLIEMLIGRKIPDKVVETANYIGFIIILGLLLYGNGMDIFRLFK